MITSTKERRAFQRMVINAPVTLFQRQQVLEGVCRDLSANGMGVEVNEHGFDLAQPIRVSLATSSNLLPPFEAQARIVRVLEEEGGLLLALEFLPLACARTSPCSIGLPPAGRCIFGPCQPCLPARVAAQGATQLLASTGWTLNCLLSTSVLLVGASWPMGSWAGPVGSSSR